MKIFIDIVPWGTKSQIFRGSQRDLSKLLQGVMIVRNLKKINERLRLLQRGYSFERALESCVQGNRISARQRVCAGHLNGSLTPSSGSVYTKSAPTSSLRRSDDRPTWVVCWAISITQIPQRDKGTPYKEVSVAARSCCPRFGWRPALRSLPRVVFGRRIARCHQICVYEMRIREQLTGQPPGERTDGRHSPDYSLTRGSSRVIHSNLGIHEARVFQGSRVRVLMCRPQWDPDVQTICYCYKSMVAF